MADKYKVSLYTQIAKYIDINTLIVASLLVIAGLVCIYSATINISPDKFNKQMISAAVGLVSMVVISRINISFIKRYSMLFYIIILLLLGGVLIFGTKGDYGTVGWYRFGGFSFQPAEFAKIGLILAVSNYLSTKGNSVGNMLDMGKLGIVFMLPFILILLQPDMGTALTLLILYLGLLFWAGSDLFYGFFMIFFIAMFIASLSDSETAVIIIGIISAITLLFFRKRIHIYVITLLIIIGVAFVSDTIFDLLPLHQQNRINVFLNPEEDVRGIGYNLAQAKLAVGSGGIVGKGYMQGSITQYRYVPMHYTDFVYSVIAEEFGFIGAVTILLGLLYLCYRGINIAYRSRDIFSSLVAFGSSSIMLFHIVYNIGMVLGLFPVMGIPLPFFSQGGTFLISNLIYVGLLMNINKNTYKV